MSFYTDNPLRDADRYDAYQQKWLDSRPICHACGEPIQEDVCLMANGHKYHADEDCKEAFFSKIIHEFYAQTV